MTTLIPHAKRDAVRDVIAVALDNFDPLAAWSAPRGADAILRALDHEGLVIVRKTDLERAHKPAETHKGYPTIQSAAVQNEIAAMIAASQPADKETPK